MIMKMKDRKVEFLQPPFREPFLLSTDDFIRYCADRDLRISRDFLEKYEKAGLLFPAVRVFFPVRQRRQAVSEEIIYQVGEISQMRDVVTTELNGEKIIRCSGQWLTDYKYELPCAHPFRPWDSYGLKVEHSLNQEILGKPARMYYAPEQVFIVDLLKRALSIEIEKVAKVDLAQLKMLISDQYLLNSLFYDAQKTYSDMLAFIEIKASMHLKLFSLRSADYAAMKKLWEDEHLSNHANNALKSLAISEDKIYLLLRALYQRGWNHDPLVESWKLIQEYLPAKLFNKTRGSLLLSFNYYDQAARMEWFLKKTIDLDIERAYAMQFGSRNNRCRRCGKIFEKNPLRKGGRVQITCSKECSELNKYERKRIMRLNNRSTEL